MTNEDAPTQRFYNTSVGPVDFARAAAAVDHIVEGGLAPDQFRVLSALCTAAFRGERTIKTSRGMINGLGAAQLLTRLRSKLDVSDIDALWSLLFVLFETR